MATTKISPLDIKNGILPLGILGNTVSVGTNDTTLATTAFVQAALVASTTYFSADFAGAGTSGSPVTLAVDPATKANIASPTFTGTPLLTTTPTTGDNTHKLADTAFIQQELLASTTYFSNKFTGTGTSLDPVSIPDYITEPVAYGDVVNTIFPGTSMPSGLAQTGGPYTINNGAAVSGGSNYFTNFIGTNTYSASLNYRMTMEFTLTTKPTASTEGLWLGRLSINTFGRSSMTVRLIYVDSTHWTVNLYWITGFTTEILVASTPIYTVPSIAMTNGAKYRVEVTFNNPDIFIKFSRVTSGLDKYQDEIESCFVKYSYIPTIDNNIPQICNTGLYAFGAIGSSPVGVYNVTKFQTEFFNYINPDVLVVGDSISVGYNAGSINDTYVSRLFKGTNKRYVTFAGAGDRTDEVIYRLPEIQAMNPKYVLLELGWNDISSGGGSAAFGTKLATILDAIISYGAIPIVLRLPQTLSGYDVQFFTVCQAKNVQLIDVGGSLIGTLDAFDIHPNAEGHQRIATLCKLEAPAAFGNEIPLQFLRGNNNIPKLISSNVNADDYTTTYFIDCTSGNVTLHLLAATNELTGKQIKVVRVDGTGNICNIATQGSDTINGGASITLTSQYQGKTVEGYTNTSFIAY